jgi:hypothetical protein
MIYKRSLFEGYCTFHREKIKSGLYIELVYSNKDQLQKENLHSDDQQFNQYQPNEQSPLTSSHRTQKGNITTYDVGNPHI